MTLEAMPLSANGKIDRKVLEQTDLHAVSRAKRPMRAPRTALEATIVEAFVAVLGLAAEGAVGVDDWNGNPRPRPQKFSKLVFLMYVS